MNPKSAEIYVNYTLGDGDEPELVLTIASKDVEKKLAAAVISATGNDPYASEEKLVRRWIGTEAVIIFKSVLTAEQRKRMENNLDMHGTVVVKRLYTDVLKELNNYWA